MPVSVIDKTLHLNAIKRPTQLATIIRTKNHRDTHAVLLQKLFAVDDIDMPQREIAARQQWVNQLFGLIAQVAGGSGVENDVAQLWLSKSDNKTR